jgi:transcriptional regulator with XRE-family HTH domain
LSNHDTQNQIDTTDLGWRIQQLRLRRGLQQKALARLANVDAAFLNRLERGGARRSRPKPETIHRLLDALYATSAEREAVFRVEVSPLSGEEIQAYVAEIAADTERLQEPIMLIDDRWYHWYINGIGRRMFGLSEEEYQRSLGVHTLGAYVDPAQPLYSRYNDERREYHFAQRVLSFKLFFAAQQFDRWYLDVEGYIKSFPMGRKIWDRPEVYAPPTFMLSHEGTYRDPKGRTYRLMGQVDILLKNPRFMLIQLKPQDAETRALLESLHGVAE